MMQQLTQITDTLFALIVPSDAHSFESIEYNDTSETEIVFDDKTNYCINEIIPCFYGIFKIVGTVSTTEVDFDCWHHLPRNNEKWISYKDYEDDESFKMNSKEAFLYRLSSKGITPTNETKILILSKI